LQQATEIYEEAAFSPHPPAARQVESARRTWGRSFWEWLRMVGANALGRTPQSNRKHRRNTEKEII